MAAQPELIFLHAASVAIAGEGMVLCVLVNGGNDAYAVKFLNALLEAVRAPQ